MRRVLNALEGPISKSEQNLRNSSSPSGGPRDQALKTKLKPSSGSNSLLHSVGYTWTHARVCKTTLVCLHQCQLLSGFSDSPSCAQHPHVPFPPGLTPCSLLPRLTLSHLPAHNSWAQALTQVHGHAGHSRLPGEGRRIQQDTLPWWPLGSLPRVAPGDMSGSESLMLAPPPWYSHRK